MAEPISEDYCVLKTVVKLNITMVHLEVLP